MQGRKLNTEKIVIDETKIHEAFNTAAKSIQAICEYNDFSNGLKFTIEVINGELILKSNGKQ